MEPISAALSALGAGLNLWGNLDKNRSAREIAAGQQAVDTRTVEAKERVGLESLWSRERLAQIQGMLEGTKSYEQGQTDRTRAYYSFATARELRGTYVAVAGVAIIGLALYFGRKQ